jgi:ABC-type antimicrobial peptide transport system permease subunit
VGITCSLLIFSWVLHELSYDNFHQNKNELYLVIQHQNFQKGVVTVVNTTPPAVAEPLRKNYPEISKVTRLTSISCSIEYGDMNFTESVTFVEPSFFKMFTFPLKKGNIKSFFSDISSIVLTERMAGKYFGDANPIGKILKLNISSSELNFKVTGVLKDIPHNSSLQNNIFIHLENARKVGFDLSEWGLSNFTTFVQLHKNVSYEDVSKKVFDLFRIYKSKKNIRDIVLYPLPRLHLYSTDGSGGDIVYIRIFSLIALLVLVIACINFVNFATGRTDNRSKEVGIRKVVGAVKMNLVRQLFGESILIVFFAMLLSIILLFLVFPVFKSLLARDFSINLFSVDFFLILISIFLFTCIAAGSYPAFFLSSFRPINVLGKTFKSQSRKGWLRKILVFFQYAISVCLILSAIIVYKQLNYIDYKNIGLDKDNIIYLRLSGDMADKYEAMKSEWLNNPNISNVTISSSLPTNVIGQSGGWKWEGDTSDGTLLISLGLFGIDYQNTFKIPMSEGRFFSYDFSDDHSVVINEKLVKIISSTSPIGHQLSFAANNFNIVGVVKDFHFKSLRNEIKPLVMFPNNKILTPLPRNYIFIRLNPVKVEDSIKFVEKIFNKFNPGFTFEYNFLDEAYRNLYQDERQLGRLIIYGTFLAIFLSCLGILGLSSFMVEQRTKEIAVRKVFGASVTGIIALISKEFIYLVFWANILGGTIVYIVMNKWLQGFAHRTSFSWWIFLIAAVLTLGIALLMVGLQTLRAGLRNPAQSLKYE